ncbi:MAG: hypothetical protein H8E66_17060 [Planctomycetes bacterium]|nr:hypothetical protein [Planctomycetota bacterium]
MHVAIGILSLWAVANDPLLHIESQGDGRIITVVADLREAELPARSESKNTAKHGESILTLRLVDDDGTLGAPIFGEYRRVGEQLHFTPRYRLIPEYEYRATFHATDDRRVSLTHLVPKRPPSKPASVTQIFPSSTVLPANHLKFYIHFSKPMREGRAIFDRIHLLDKDGDEVPDPWRRTELWTEDARRLTLWIHPGRVKTGVNLREELGPVLEPQRRYTLMIDSSLQDADGQRLGKIFKKPFATTVADRERPEPDQWQLLLPEIGTRQQLGVRFEESLDHALSRRFLEVQDSRGGIISGRIDLGESETGWSFTPNVAWSDEDYRLLVDPLLEDLAGNTPERVFDTDLTAAAQTPPVLTLPFRPRHAR